MSDTLNTLVRDACSIGFYGPKSAYRARLQNFVDRETLKAVGQIMDRYHSDFYDKNAESFDSWLIGYFQDLKRKAENE